MNPADLGQLCPLQETTGQSGHVALADCRACAETIYLPPYEVYATCLLVHAVTSVILVSAFGRHCVRHRSNICRGLIRE